MSYARAFVLLKRICYDRGRGYGETANVHGRLAAIEKTENERRVLIRVRRTDFWPGDVVEKYSGGEIDRTGR